MSERFGVEVVAYVLMRNHYHLMVRTPEANLSRAIWGLGGGYGVWFNRRHGRCGVICSEGGSRRRLAAGAQPPPGEEQVREWLKCLRAYRWSSYRAYAGREKGPKWLRCGLILGRVGAASMAIRRFEGSNGGWRVAA